MQKIFWLFSLGIILTFTHTKASCLLDMAGAFYFTTPSAEVKYYQQLLKTAEKYQAEKHKNQKHGKLMFADHINQLRQLLKRFGYRKDNVRDLKLHILVELHDVREDTDATYEDILTLFKNELADGVESLTYTHGLSRQAQYEEKQPFWKNYTLAATAKHLDRIANFEVSIQEAFQDIPSNIFWYKRYKNEWDQFFHRNEEINLTDPRDVQVFQYLKSLFTNEKAVNRYIGYPRQPVPTPCILDCLVQGQLGNTDIIQFGLSLFTTKEFNAHIEKVWEEIKKD
jgi:hypothetical protein